MKIAVFGRKVDSSFSPGLRTFFTNICKYNCETYIFKPFYDALKDVLDIDKSIKDTFTDYSSIGSDFSFIFSLGGDGTFLEAVRFVRDKKVPIIGINTGRLGFLANISTEAIETSLECLFSGQYRVEQRHLISFQSDNNPFYEFPFALNEITVQKRDTSLITIELLVNGNELNTYWTDGLIISTPTGSTAYSLSTGGPIVSPDCRVLIISPIASHNLTVRPFVITDNFKIKIRVHSRSGNYMATLDSQTSELSTDTEIEIGLAPFTIFLAHLHDQTFYSTIRKKLMWGADIRN